MATISYDKEAQVSQKETAVGTNSDLGHLANAEDARMGRWAAVKKNKLAFAWCVYAIWNVVLVSFENQASGIVLGIPQFRKDFGDSFEGQYVINEIWQGAISGGPAATTIFGALFGAQFSDWYGRRWLFIACLAISFVAITLEVVATNMGVFFGGKLINGVATGALASVCTTYVGEIAPLALRGLLTCMIALSFTLGPFTVSLIVKGTGDVDSRWAYRAVFLSQYGVAAISAAFVWFMPESPWWLASKNKDAELLHALRRLGYRNGEEEKRAANIKLTLEEIKKETEGVTYMECFRASNLRRTIISLMPLAIQAMSGVAFAASYATYYMQLSGYSTADSFKLGIVQQVLSAIGNVMSWFLTDLVGRRSLTLWGLVALTVNLFTLAALAVVGTADALKGAVAMILIYCWLYNLTIGATAYNILAEVATSRLRVKTIAVSIAFQNSLYLMWSFVLPKLFNPNQANLGGKLGFIFGAFSVLSVVYVYFYQPETAKRSYEEIDEMFMKRIPARQFKTYTTQAQTTGEAVRRASLGQQ